MPIFRVNSVKIYTGQKKFTRIYCDKYQVYVGIKQQVFADMKMFKYFTQPDFGNNKCVHKKRVNRDYFCSILSAWMHKY